MIIFFKDGKEEEMSTGYEPKECGKRMARLRKELGMTQMQAAEKLNISWDHYRGIETGRRSGSIELMVDIASVFNASLDYLILGIEHNEIQIKKQSRELIELLSKLME